MPTKFPPVTASPTKNLFLEALTSDLDLADAVSDLVDNSADAALRIRKDRNYHGLEVSIRFTHKQFRIEDNCGGIDLETAANVLFSLGRPRKDRPATPGQIGRFGIGMKRDVFMMGDTISVESWTKTSHFLIKIDVQEWAKKDAWDLKFTTYEDNIKVSDEKVGTTIMVEDLRPPIAQEFGLPSFEPDLIETLQKEQKSALQNGLKIAVNGTTLTSEPYKLKLLPQHIEPAFFQTSYNGSKRPKLFVELLAGIDESKPKDAGWYIACNGRFILVADKTSKTGWGEEADVALPKMHPQFARFRGYVFFDCEDPARLLWNSTKTGLNTDSHVYREVRQMMINATRPVIDFLNQLDAEKELDARPLHRTVEKAESKAVAAVKAAAVANRNFRFKGLMGDTDPDQAVRIAYVKRLGDVQKVRRKLQVEKNRDVGIRTFDYYFDHEIRKKR
jgi:hypothetical protein